MNNIFISFPGKFDDNRARPAAIMHFWEKLSSHQQEILDRLPGFGSTTHVDFNEIDMVDLASFTAVTGDEFALFCKENIGLIVRGNKSMVNINNNDARQLREQGYRWVGHTHPGIDNLCLTPSDGDYSILECFDQESSDIYNSLGECQSFYKGDAVWDQNSSTNSKSPLENTAQ